MSLSLPINNKAYAIATKAIKALKRYATSEGYTLDPLLLICKPLIARLLGQPVRSQNSVQSTQGDSSLFEALSSQIRVLVN